MYLLIIYILWQTESICFGMVPMAKGHSANAIQEAIEKMVNKAKINDLTKIMGISKIYYIISHYIIKYSMYIYIH